MAQQRVVKPLRPNTRQRRARVGSLTYAANATTSIQFPQVGYLNNIWINVRGTITPDAASAFEQLGPWNLISRIRCNINIGSAVLYDCTGFQAYLLAGLQERGFEIDKAGSGDTVPDADIFAASVVAAPQTWNLNYYIPISLNPGSLFDLGLINLQAPELRFFFEIVWGSGNDALAPNPVADFVGTAEIFYEYFEVPPEDVEKPPLVIVRRISQRQAIATTGDVTYTVEKQGQLLNLIHTVILNGTRNSASVDGFRFRLNRTDDPYRMSRAYMRFLNRKYTGLNWPVGVTFWDFFHSGEDLSAGDFRDAIDTEMISTIESIVEVNSAAVLGASNNFLDSTRTIVQLLQRPMR